MEKANAKKIDSSLVTSCWYIQITLRQVLINDESISMEVAK